MYHFYNRHFQALPKINRAYVGAKKERTELRVSKNTWLSDNDSVVEKVSRRVNWVTGLNTFLKDDHGKMEKKEEFEFLQVRTILQCITVREYIILVQILAFHLS